MMTVKVIACDSHHFQTPQTIQCNPGRDHCHWDVASWDKGDHSKQLRMDLSSGRPVFSFLGFFLFLTYLYMFLVFELLKDIDLDFSYIWYFL